jgi:hypothetical protein
VVVQPDGSTNEPPLSDAVPATVPVTTEESALPPVRKTYRDRLGYGEDFHWITGQLSRVHTAEGSFWVVRYAPVGQLDKYGGSVVLTPVADMRNYREGDLVSIEGEVLQDRKAPAHLGGALYRATAISMVTRGDPEQK